ncbi:hypothetical protein [Moorella sp. E308F]|nr:hypothetical protein [Moorella sp. E308F]
MGRARHGPPYNMIHIEFWDKFSPAAKIFYKEKLQSLQFDRYFVRLYGLSKQRGLVATIPIEEMDLLFYPPVHHLGNSPLFSKDSLLIGLPWEARMEPTWREWVVPVVHGIVEHIRRIDELVKAERSGYEIEKTLREIYSQDVFSI